METQLQTKGKFISIKTKMYIFVIVIVLAVAAGTSTIAFKAEADQIDRYYKQNTADNATNFATMVDGDFLAELRAVAASDEFQKLREKAEKSEDESLVRNYLKKKGMWAKYRETRDMITTYLKNMKGIKYLYIIAHGDKDAKKDMYLVDDKENPIYETGYYEDREAELLGKDIENLPEPTISNGDWGWLCSDFKPVYDSKGKCVCIVGCDIGMDDVMEERKKLMLLLIFGALAFTVIVTIVAVMFINRTLVRPLNSMTNDMKKFKPSEGLGYEESGVIDIDIKTNDEIGEIYRSIRGMQIRIIDYLKDLFELQEDKKKAEHDLKNKDEQIDKLSTESYTDALTGVGNKAAYINRMDELNHQMKDSDLEFAIVMVDLNRLKFVNDKYGHRSGDAYIKGCCHIVCEVFKHSPVFRIGGDEFVVLLQGQDYSNRNQLCDQLKEEFEKTYQQKDASPWLRYSAAVGMSESTVGDLSTEFVFKRADEEMYKDKARIKEKYGFELR